MPWPAAAVDVSVQPNLWQRIEFDNNLRLLFDNNDEVAGSITSAGAQLVAATESYSVTLTPRVNFLQFSNAQNPDREDLFGNLLMEKFGEQYSTFLNVSADRRGTIQSELAATGLIVDNLNRDTITVAPGINYQLTPRLGGTLSGSWSDVSFEQAENSRLNDYTFWNSSASARFQWLPRLALTARVDISDFNSPATNGSTRTYIAWVGADAIISPTTTARISAGINHSELEFQSIQLIQFPGLPPFLQSADDDASETGYVVDAAIDKSFETARISATYVRSLSPSSLGAQSLDDDYRISAEKRLTPRLTFRSSVRFIDRVAEGDSQAALDLKFLQAHALFDFSLTRKLRLELGYRYSFREFRGQNADGHALVMTLRYRPDPTTFWTN